MSRWNRDKKGGTAEAQAFCPFRAEGFFFCTREGKGDDGITKGVVVVRPFERRAIRPCQLLTRDYGGQKWKQQSSFFKKRTCRLPGITFYPTYLSRCPHPCI